MIYVDEGCAVQELLHLDLSETAVEDAALSHLAALPRVQHLRINNQPALDDISDAGLAEVSRISTLRHLEVRGNHGITAAGDPAYLLQKDSILQHTN
jgi:hypothetical protein